ncbi:hypothetical protein KDK95_16885 [Actinospica sp. MGRD01-02]|uniref:Uncharacterized protein n=1 Tax=Actinospica acidithermotolerans TaxID=2828514 RepID=A0A941EF97_9ACTN|nr:hypothetical protein [Actinospica acidithermotolerans]MBR7827994.1 hypothetical protein [Actinospica acidithermotolerans]
MVALFLLTPAVILPAMLLLERFERYALHGRLPDRGAIREEPARHT